MPRFAKGIGNPFWQTPNKSEQHRKKAAEGVLSFGYFSLAENCSCIFRIRHIHVVRQAKKSSPLVGAGTGFKTKVFVLRQAQHERLIKFYAYGLTTGCEDLIV